MIGTLDGTQDDYSKYKICDSDISVEIRFIKDTEEYKAGEVINSGVFMNSYGRVYRIDDKHKLKFIKGEVLEDFYVKEV